MKNIIKNENGKAISEYDAYQEFAGMTATDLIKMRSKLSLIKRLSNQYVIFAVFGAIFMVPTIIGIACSSISNMQAMINLVLLAYVICFELVFKKWARALVDSVTNMKSAFNRAAKEKGGDIRPL